MSVRRGMLLPAAFTVCGLVVLIGLGTWQLERKAWKQNLVKTLRERVAATPVELPRLASWGHLTAENSEFVRVRLRANFRKDDALVYTGGSALRDDVKSPGYFVFAVGTLPTGQNVIVNRGYSKEKSYPVRTGEEEIVGYLRWPEPRPWFVTEYDAKDDIFYARDHRVMAKVRGWSSEAPFYVEQEAPIPPGGVPHPAALHPNLPNNHLQYALTWYSLALALAGVFSIWMLDRRRRRGEEIGSAS